MEALMPPREELGKIIHIKPYNVNRQVGGKDIDVRAAAADKLVALQNLNAEDLAVAMMALQAAVQVLVPHAKSSESHE